MKNVYVSKKLGSNETGNGSKEKPFASLQKAADEAAKVDKEEGKCTIFLVDEERLNIIGVDFHCKNDIEFQFWNPE